MRDFMWCLPSHLDSNIDSNIYFQWVSATEIIYFGGEVHHGDLRTFMRLNWGDVYFAVYHIFSQTRVEVSIRGYQRDVRITTDFASFCKFSPITLEVPEAVSEWQKEGF